MKVFVEIFKYLVYSKYLNIILENVEYEMFFSFTFYRGKRGDICFIIMYILAWCKIIEVRMFFFILVLFRFWLKMLVMKFFIVIWYYYL